MAEFPDDAANPGAREAAVPTYIDTKLAQFASFATPTYSDAPFAKPVPGEPGPQPGASKTIGVNAAELPRYGFHSDATPQDAYRSGLAALDEFTRKEHGVRFVKLAPARQDAVLEVLEAGEAGGFPEAKGFFKMVLRDTYEGMFSDPEYGGNRDYAGWKLVGYPGAQRAYTAYELRNGPQHKGVQGLPPTRTGRSGTCRTSSSPAPPSGRRTLARTPPAPSAPSHIGPPRPSGTGISTTPASCSSSRRDSSPASARRADRAAGRCPGPPGPDAAWPLRD